MDKIKAIPLKEVHGVKFGMKRTDVRKVLGEAKEFKKSKFSKNTTDDFGFCNIFYNLNNECEAIEIFNETEVEVDGKVIFPESVETAESVLGVFQKEDGSLINMEKSIGIYAPLGKMESILFGIPGYYE